MLNKIINTLNASVLGATLTLGTMPDVHAQKDPNAIVLNTQVEVERICALGNIVVRDQNKIDYCEAQKRVELVQEKENEEKENLYKTIAAIFLTTGALGVLAKTRVIPYFKRRENEKYEQERAEYGNHGELSGASWEESMESSTKGKSDSTNATHTGTNDELVARLRAEVIEAKRKLEEGAKNNPKGSKKSKKGNDDDFDLGDTNNLWEASTVIQDDSPKNNDTTGDTLLKALEDPNGAWIKGEIPRDFRDTEIPSEGPEIDIIGKSGNTAPSKRTTNWDKTVSMNTPDITGTGDNWTKTVTIETAKKTDIPEATTEEKDRKLDIPSDLEKILESNGFEINKSPETGEISIRVGKEGTSLSVLNTVLKEDGIQTEKTIIKYDEVYHIDDDVKRVELVYFGKLPYTVAHMKLIYKNEARLFIQINIAKA